jgi:hypothetical protein
MNVERYDRGRTALAEWMRGIPEVADCWEYGSITNPGVSDLDVIVVVQDSPPMDLGTRLRKELLPEAAQEAMAHASLVAVNESNAMDVFYWDDLHVKSLLRDVPVVNHLSPLLVKARRMAMIVDFLFERRYRIRRLESEIATRPRRALGLLKSYRYAVHNFDSVFGLGSHAAAFANFSAKLESARTNYVHLDPAAQAAAITAAHLAAINFDDHFVRHSFESFGKATFVQGPGIGNGKARLTFPDGMQFAFVDRLEDANESDVAVPQVLLAHFARYAGFDGSLSRKLRASLRFRDIAEIEDWSVSDSVYKELLDLRIGAANAWFDALRGGGFRTGLFKFGWYLNVH